jgi:hypothetical protein
MLGRGTLMDADVFRRRSIARSSLVDRVRRLRSFDVQQLWTSLDIARFRRTSQMERLCVEVRC